ncbi:MAG: hypothetical protein H0X70_02520 [Segetibacter sp.]|nr:hypothetical protein [Segetibacter sp.]
MPQASEPLNTLHDIRQMMEKSSRFISLSGWSGVAAGICALVGASFAFAVLHKAPTGEFMPVNLDNHSERISAFNFAGYPLITIAILTFIAAFVLAFIFTYVRSKKNNVPIWGNTAQRLLINVSIPMIVGGVYLIKLVQIGAYGLIAPGCLIFYGLALINGSKYTLGEVRYLGYGQILLGIVNCFAIGYGLYFWAIGFGVLHILYGLIMWQKYERG